MTLCDLVIKGSLDYISGDSSVIINIINTIIITTIIAIIIIAVIIIVTLTQVINIKMT